MTGGMVTATAPFSAARSISSTARATSWAGATATPLSRSGEWAHTLSSSQSLYARAKSRAKPASSNDVSPMTSPPNSTCSDNSIATSSVSGAPSSWPDTIWLNRSVPGLRRRAATCGSR